MLNQVQLIGRLGKDPEIRTLGSGTRMANMSIATSETWKDKHTGERKEKTEWHNVVVFNEQIVKVCEDYVQKGDLIYIRGKLQTRKWQDQQGNDRYSTEIVLQNFDGELRMLGGKRDRDDSDRGTSSGGGDSHDRGGGQQQRGGSDRGGYDGGYGGGQGGSFSADLDDEIPF